MCDACAGDPILAISSSSHDRARRAAPTLSSRVCKRSISATGVVVSEFWRLDATAQAALVREKSVRPLELVEAAIARIASLNPKLNTVVTPMFDHARAEAAVPQADGPFTGVPFLLKDLLAEFAGVRFTEGSAFLDGRYTPETDSELTRRLRRAGLIVVGKTNTPEFGILPTTEPRLFGPTRNPWSLDRTPGRSSGGSAAAAAPLDSGDLADRRAVRRALRGRGDALPARRVARAGVSVGGPMADALEAGGRD